MGSRDILSCRIYMVSARLVSPVNCHELQFVLDNVSVFVCFWTDNGTKKLGSISAMKGVYINSDRVYALLCTSNDKLYSKLNYAYVLYLYTKVQIVRQLTYMQGLDQVANPAPH